MITYYKHICGVNIRKGASISLVRFKMSTRSNNYSLPTSEFGWQLDFPL